MVHIYPGLLLFLQFGNFFANTINEGRQQTLLGSVLQHKRKDVTILKTQSRLNKKLATNGPKGSWFACKAGRVLTFAFMAACAAPALSCWVLVLGLLSGSPFLSRGNVHIYIYYIVWILGNTGSDTNMFSFMSSGFRRCPSGSFQNKVTAKKLVYILHTGWQICVCVLHLSTCASSGFLTPLGHGFETALRWYAPLVFAMDL